MGDITVVLFAALTLVALALVAVGAVRRVRMLLVAGIALLSVLGGAWIAGVPGIVVGLAVVVVFLVARR